MTSGITLVFEAAKALLASTSGSSGEVLALSAARGRADDESAESLQQQRAAFQRGDFDAAGQALTPILDLAEVDLLVAVRVAETLTACGDPQADAAWQRVRRLDRHQLYAAHRVDR